MPVWLKNVASKKKKRKKFSVSEKCKSVPLTDRVKLMPSEPNVLLKKANVRRVTKRLRKWRSKSGLWKRWSELARSSSWRRRLCWRSRRRRSVMNSSR